VLAELKARLHAMGIEPLGALERIPSVVESRVWSMPSADTGDSGERESIADDADVSIVGAMTESTRLP